MLYTLDHVRENLRTRDGKRVFFLGTGDQLTSTARDYLQRERIEILPAAQAKITRYRGPDGCFYEGKPEFLTQLSGDLLVPKTHPRIVFRGKLDSLEAQLLLAIRALPEESGALTEILTRVREILRAEVLETPLEEKPLCGLRQEEIRTRSQHPQNYFGIPHFMPSPEDPASVLRLNALRAQVREAELSAAAAFGREREDLLRALNRLSSLLYVLMLQIKGGSHP